MSSFQDIIKGESPVLVDFHADWCKPCKEMLIELKSVKENFGSELKILKINVDNNQALSDKFDVKGVPTFILFNKGVVKWRRSGLVDKTDFISIINKHI
jgi:thioredoxin 1